MISSRSPKTDSLTYLQHKARESRKKALSELDNYKFATETEIWL